MGKLYDLYIRLMISLGAEPPPGYEHLLVTKPTTAAKPPVPAKPAPPTKAPQKAETKPVTPPKPKPEPVTPPKPKPEPVTPPKPKPEPVIPPKPISPVTKPVIKEVSLAKPEVASLPDWMAKKPVSVTKTVESFPVIEEIEEVEPFPVAEEEVELFPIAEEEVELFPVAEEEVELFPIAEEEVEPFPIAEEEVEPFPVVETVTEPVAVTEPVRPISMTKLEPMAELTPTFNIDPKFPPIGSMESVRALYISYFAIGHSGVRHHILQLLDSTEFNAVVIDVKGDHGWVSYPTQVLTAKEIGADRPSIKNFDEIMAQLKRRKIYTIARIVTFKDDPFSRSYPEYAVKIKGSTELWQDREGLGWSDPFSIPVWDYNVELAVEAAQKGFDEIQFDYVRFPTLSQVGEPQFSQEAIKEARISAITGFLSMARGQLKPFGVKLAADTFGYTCWRKDDTLIGQDIERLGQYVDVLCPMLYPSTFGNGIPGYKNAVAYPYEVVYQSAQKAVERINRLGLGCTVRPWIQDFQDYRFDNRVYGKTEIQAQIKGCFDSGSTGFMVWNPHVEYTAGAYAPMLKYG